MDAAGIEHRIRSLPELVQQIAYAALDALRFAVPLELCAYLHLDDGEGPQLYLRAPDLASMNAGEAFDVFTALRDALDASDERRIALAGFDAVAIRSSGERSRGVFVAGRRSESLRDDEVDLVTAMAEAIGVACHAVAPSSSSATGAPSSIVEPASVGVRVDGGLVRADVTFTRGASEPSAGTATAPATTEAVALAAADALGSDAKLIEITEGTVAGERIMIALFRDDLDRPLLGTAIVGADPVRAAAAAAADALADGPSLGHSASR
ncbi:MAG TPA: hypothetical protein VM345_15945 [Acidimicrobiales bacterium]|nr:hypothetical protein [Acidimicrobiales bacterium]